MMQAKRRVDQLRPHPDNARVYGDAADADLIASVKENGILQPLLVTSDGRIISGHRRREAALANGIAEVPVMVSDKTDENDIRALLIHCNRQRPKTNEQKGREALVLLEVEEERARRRQAQAGTRGDEGGRGNKKTLEEPVPQGFREQQSRDIVGKALGVSGRTVADAVEVVKVIDDLEQKGQPEKAEEIREMLNRRGVKPAKKAAEAINPASAPADPPPTMPLSCFEVVRRQIKALRDAIADASAHQAGAELAEQLCPRGGDTSRCKQLEELARVVAGCVPAAMGCVSCDGTNAACPVCKGRGWVCRRVLNQLPSEQRQRLRPIRDCE